MRRGGEALLRSPPEGLHRAPQPRREVDAWLPCQLTRGGSNIGMRVLDVAWPFRPVLDVDLRAEDFCKSLAELGHGVWLPCRDVVGPAAGSRGRRRAKIRRDDVVDISEVARLG